MIKEVWTPTRILLLGIVLGVMAPSTLLAHPKGTSLIELYPMEEALEAIVEVNRDDILNLCADRIFSDFSEEEKIKVTEKIRLYIQNRIQVEIDGDLIYPSKFLHWYLKRPDSSRVPIDTVPFDSNTISLRLSWPKKPGAEILNFSVQMFPELVAAAISNIRVHWKEKILINKYYLPDDVLWLKLHPDSLNALWEKSLAPGAAPDIAAQKSNAITTGLRRALELDSILFLLLLALFTTGLKPLFPQILLLVLAQGIGLFLPFENTLLSTQISGAFAGIILSLLAVENLMLSGVENKRLKVNPWRWMLIAFFGLAGGFSASGYLNVLGLGKTGGLAPLELTLGTATGQIILSFCFAVAARLLLRFPGAIRVCYLLAGFLALAGGLYRVISVFLN